MPRSPRPRRRWTVCWARVHDLRGLCQHVGAPAQCTLPPGLRPATSRGIPEHAQRGPAASQAAWTPCGGSPCTCPGYSREVLHDSPGGGRRKELASRGRYRRPHPAGPDTSRPASLGGSVWEEQRPEVPKARRENPSAGSPATRPDGGRPEQGTGAPPGPRAALRAPARSRRGRGAATAAKPRKRQEVVST